MSNKAMQNTSGIYAITDCVNLNEHELIRKTEEILSVGVSLFQYRNKTTNQQKKKELAQKLQSLCIKYKTPFIVNDDVALANELSADGVHIGKNDENINNARNILGQKIIGVSCYNNIEQAIDAEKAGADYVAFGSVFPSTTKPDAKRADIERLKEAKSILSIPIVAIGGITPENAKSLVEVNINFLAVISGLYSVTDTIKATQSYNELFM